MFLWDMHQQVTGSFDGSAQLDLAKSLAPLRVECDSDATVIIGVGVRILVVFAVGVRRVQAATQPLGNLEGQPALLREVGESFKIKGMRLVPSACDEERQGNESTEAAA